MAVSGRTPVLRNVFAARGEWSGLPYLIGKSARSHSAREESLGAWENQGELMCTKKLPKRIMFFSDSLRYTN